MAKRVLLLLLVVGILVLSGCVPTDTLYVRERYDFGSSVREISLHSHNGSIHWYPLAFGRDPYVIVEKEAEGWSKTSLEVFMHQLTVEDRGTLNAVDLRTTAPVLPQGVTRYSVNITVYAAPELILEYAARTSNGAIYVEHFTGMVRAETSNGRIVLGGGSGIFDLQTTNGMIDVGRVTLLGDSRAQTSNGRISGYVTISRGRSFNFVTSNGNIDLFFPEQMRGTFDMAATNGRLEIDLADQYGSSRGQLTVGRGDPVITLRTSNGNITVGADPEAQPSR